MLCRSGLSHLVKESLINWVACFHLSREVPACASKHSDVTAHTSSFMPQFPLSSKKPRQVHLDQVRVLLQSYATALKFVFCAVPLTCDYIAQLFNRITAAANMLHGRTSVSPQNQKENIFHRHNHKLHWRAVALYISSQDISG